MSTRDCRVLPVVIGAVCALASVPSLAKRGRVREGVRTLAWLAATCITLLPGPASASEQPAKPTRIDTIEAEVRQPRPFGHFIGDVLTQQILLDLPGGRFEPAESPRVERVGVWFERRAARTITAEDGRRWLLVEHQLVNAPANTETIQLPTWRMKDSSGTRELVVPALTVSVSPLTTWITASDALQLMKPDREPPRIAIAPLERRFWGFAAACALVALCWFAWIAWRNWIARKEQPFARAWEEVSALGDRSPEAWQAVHRAFDRTAGRVVQTTTLATLFRSAPHLATERGRIEQFYAQSSALFFGSGLPNDAISVRELCRDLRRLERRHER